MPVASAILPLEVCVSAGCGRPLAASAGIFRRCLAWVMVEFAGALFGPGSLLISSVSSPR